MDLSLGRTIRSLPGGCQIAGLITNTNWRGSRRDNSSFQTSVVFADNSGEIFNLRWSDVDLQNDVLTVRESKSGKPRTIPLRETVSELLSNLPSRFLKGYVFPSPYKEEDDEEQRPLTDINQHVPPSNQKSEA